MKYYPLFLNIRNKKCLVIGGGSVATRKVYSLLEAGADIHVISPKITHKLNKLVKEKKIKYLPRYYEKGDLENFSLVFSATGDKVVNKLIAEEARVENVLLNTIDEPELCDFIVPSSITRDDLIIAISTSGKSPLLARKIRIRLEGLFGKEYGEFIRIIGAVRAKLLTKKEDFKYNRKLLEKLIDSKLLQFICEGDKDGIDTLIKDIFGQKFSLDSSEDSVNKADTK